jgi:prepilin-type N-terminal cleavage/methylation domain-containing protein
MDGSPDRRRGLSLLEVLMAVAILAFCFVPILTHSRATVHETESSQEDILARHFLVDLAERYKAASMDELRDLPPTEPEVPLGQDPIYIRNDGLLSDRTRVYQQLQALAASGYRDGALAGLKKFVDLSTFMKLTRLATFRENIDGQEGVHELTCAVRWKPRAGPGERSLRISKIVVRVPPTVSTLVGPP